MLGRRPGLRGGALSPSGRAGVWNRGKGLVAEEGFVVAERAIESGKPLA